MMPQTTTIRLSFSDFDPASDYERLVQVYNANYPDYAISVSESRYFDEMIDRTKYHFKRYKCIGQASGMVLGFGTMRHEAWMYHPQKFSVNILVDPEYQGRGIGSKIYEKLSQDLETLHAITAWAFVKEDLPRSAAFAMKRGFVEKKRAWESRLNPSEVDVSLFQKYADRAAKRGIRITNLPEEQARNPTALKGIYELVQELMIDVPMPVPYTKVSYGQWEAIELKNPSLVSDSYFIASNGSKYVGVSYVQRSDKEPRALHQAFTGVRREYRGRGIAIALKLKVIDYARRNGYDKVKTWNDSDNAPMLAVNTKLGFKREVGWITMEKNL